MNKKMVKGLHIVIVLCIAFWGTGLAPLITVSTVFAEEKVEKVETVKSVEIVEPEVKPIIEPIIKIVEPNVEVVEVEVNRPPSTPPGPYCGDGIQNGDEECDDENNDNNDFCSNQCEEQTPICHATHSPTHPYNFLWVANNAQNGGGANDHSGHESDIIPITDENGDEVINIDDCNSYQHYCGDEIVHGDEQCDDGPNGSDTCTDECTLIECPETITVLAYKVVCEDESYLPNWGTSGIQGAEPGTIISTTAQDYVDASNGHCWLEENWDFQWGYNGQAQKQTGTHVGPAPNGTGWNDFDTSTANNGQTPASVSIGNLDGENTLWFRENLKQNYIPFSYPPDASPGSDISAEFYCHNDILKYDNYDYIQNFQSGNTYYCIGFNAPLEEENELTIYADKIVCESETDLPNWHGGANITATTAQDYVDSHPNCHFEENWDFQWGIGVNDPGENYYGYAGGEWNNFDTLTGDSTSAMAIVSDSYMNEGGTIKLREVLKEGYIPFSFSSSTPGNAPGSDISAEFWCHTDVANYDNYDYIRNSEWDGEYYCVAFNILEENPNPYCGDGIINQEWEECDGIGPRSLECSEQCQLESNECSDLVLARVNVDEVNNFDGGGDMTSDIYLGSDSYVIPAGTWFALYWNGSYYTDSDITGYEDVPGLAVERVEGSVRAVLYGSWPNSASKEHIHGNIEFYNANVTGQINDVSGNNILENGSNGTMDYTPTNDEVWLENGDDNHSYFWLTTTTADDGFYSNWEIIEDCEEYCGDGIKNGDEECDGEDGLTNPLQICTEQCTIINPVCNPDIELMTNGSFETPVGTNPVGWDIYPDATPGLIWDVNWETSVTSYGGHTRPEIANLELHFGVNSWPAADGDQYAELDGDWDGPGRGINGEPASTRISQTIETIVGETYEVKFWFKARPNTNLNNNKVQLRINGVDKYAVDADGNGNWNEYTFSFEATEYYSTIEFADIGTPEDSLGSFLDNLSLKCVFEEEPNPYCGDGIVNQDWEQCDNGGGPRSVGCSEQCQYVVPQDCSDLVLAKVNVDEVNNFTGNGDISSNIYLGSASYVIPAGTWFALYWNGSYYTDPDIAGYEDVPGLAVQRLEGSVRAVLYGSRSSADKEHIHGNIEFYNANVLTPLRNDPSNDNPGNNTLENGFDGNGVGSYNAGNDEVWLENGDDNHSYFWLTTTTADDGYYTDWQIIEDCDGGDVCGVKFFDVDQDGINNNDDYNIADWIISLWPKIDCTEGEEWADEVVSFNQGPNVAPERSDPNKALGVAENNDTMNFVSLGIAGELILKFDNFIENGTGNDIQVIETSYGSPSCAAYPEYIHVYASQDGNTWTDLGTQCQEGDPSFDLGSLAWAQYVKLVDETTSTPDGFDVDGVKALHCLTTVGDGLITLTTENGYCFEDLDSNYYYICEETRPDWFNTTPICQQVLVEDGEMEIVDFGNYNEEIPDPYCGDGIVNQEWEQCDDGPDGSDTCTTECTIIIPPSFGTLTICKQNDLNGDGILDNGEPVIPGWIFNVAGGEDIVAENGCVIIDDLLYDTYNVIEQTQSGWIQTGTSGNGTEELDGSITVVIDEQMPNPIIYFLNYEEPSDPLPYCGDWELNTGEECDDGPNGSNTCTPGCKIIHPGGGCVGPSCGPITFADCDPKTVANGIVATYPNCSITCHDGYVLKDDECIKIPIEVEEEPEGEVLGIKILPETGTDNQTFYLLMISSLMLLLGVSLRLKSEKA